MPIGRKCPSNLNRILRVPRCLKVSLEKKAQVNLYSVYLRSRLCFSPISPGSNACITSFLENGNSRLDRGQLSAHPTPSKHPWIRAWEGGITLAVLFVKSDWPHGGGGGTVDSRCDLLNDTWNWNLNASLSTVVLYNFCLPSLVFHNNSSSRGQWVVGTEECSKY